MQVQKLNEPNNFINARFIRLYPSGFALVDSDLYETLNQYRWKAVRSKTCFYAVRKFKRNGKTIYVRMHREIARAQPGEDVHHINGNTFDCRRQNLQRLDPYVHARIKSNPV